MYIIVFIKQFCRYKFADGDYPIIEHTLYKFQNKDNFMI
jgi:hypothetical protein